MEELCMRNRRLLWGAVILFVVCLAACKKENPQSPIPDSLASLQELFNPAYQIDADSIRLMIRSYLNESPVTPWDSALLAHYREKDEFFWLNDSLVSDKPAAQVADSMLFWLGDISRHGINPNLYSVDSIRERLQQIRSSIPCVQIQLLLFMEHNLLLRFIARCRKNWFV